MYVSLSRTFDEVAWLAVELGADCLKRRKANRPNFARLHLGEVGDRDADPLGELVERDLLLCHEAIEMYNYSHGYVIACHRTIVEVDFHTPQ